LVYVYSVSGCLVPSFCTKVFGFALAHRWTFAPDLAFQIQEFPGAGSGLSDLPPFERRHPAGFASAFFPILTSFFVSLPRLPHSDAPHRALRSLRLAEASLVPAQSGFLTSPRHDPFFDACERLSPRSPGVITLFLSRLYFLPPRRPSFALLIYLELLLSKII